MSLKYILLSEIANGEKTGYDIVKSFESSVGYFWNATHQQVYRELKQLHKSRLIDLRIETQSDRPDKKWYVVTNKGIEELTQWVKKASQSVPVRDSLLVKIHAASLVGTAEVLLELRRSHKNTEAILETYRVIKKNHYRELPQKNSSGRSRALYVALRKGIIGAESHIQWLDEAISIYSD